MEGDAKKEVKQIGVVTHFFPNVSVAVINPSVSIKKGDTVKICDKEGNTVLEQEVTSMQIDHKDIERAKKGEEFAMLVDGPVKEGFSVCK
ncbi:MAG: hypothetical protein ABIC57_02435 [bacterium]